MERAWVKITPFFAGLAVFAACSTAELQTSPTSGPADRENPEDPAGGDPSGPGSTDGGRDPAADAGVLPPPSSNVTIQVQPSDNGYALLNAIKGAQKSVHLTMYLLTDQGIMSALVSLHKAGKDVKVVLNETFPPGGGSNQEAWDTLKSGGVPVVWAPPAYAFTHAKTIVIDGSTLVVMTMNLTYSSAKTNREYIATDLDADDVRDAETIFDADYKNISLYLPSTKLVVSPTRSTPTDPRPRLRALIDSARTSLDVETQSLSDDTLVEGIVLAHQAGLDVRVVLDYDTLHTSGQEDALSKLKANDVPVRALSKPDIHAKAIVVDGERAFVGSMNLTPTALVANREIGLITDAASEVGKVRDAIDGDFAKGKIP